MTEKKTGNFSDAPSDDGLIAVDMRVLIKLLNTERLLRLEALQERLTTALEVFWGGDAEDDNWEDRQEGA